jgi:hypothetical protein
MPSPIQAPATGPVGEGVTIENNTGLPLAIYFLGPVSRVVQVNPKESRGVDLAVGAYEAAAEAADQAVVPFYGVLRLEARTHYWLTFTSIGPRQRAAATDDRGEQPLDAQLHFELPRHNFRQLRQRIRFQDGHLVGYSCGRAILEKTTGAMLRPETPASLFVVIELELNGRFELYPPGYNGIVLSTGGKSYLYKGEPFRGGWATYFAYKFPRGITAEAPKYPAYVGISYEVPSDVDQFLLTVGDYSELIEIPCK